jgi:hypothetical protein
MSRFLDQSAATLYKYWIQPVSPRKKTNKWGKSDHKVTNGTLKNGPKKEQLKLQTF